AWIGILALLCVAAAGGGVGAAAADPVGDAAAHSHWRLRKGRFQHFVFRGIVDGTTGRRSTPCDKGCRQHLHGFAPEPATRRISDQPGIVAQSRGSGGFPGPRHSPAAPARTDLATWHAALFGLSLAIRNLIYKPQPPNSDKALVCPDLSPSSTHGITQQYFSFREPAYRHGTGRIPFAWKGLKTLTFSALSAPALAVFTDRRRASDLGLSLARQAIRFFGRPS